MHFHGIEYTCCFTGHRPKYFSFGTDETHPECCAIKAFLRQKIAYLINEKHVVDFLSGGAVGVDTWAMEETIMLMENNRHIRLHCVLPYETMPERFAPPDRKRFARMRPHLRSLISLGTHYHSGCMMKRNKFMVDHSLYVIAVWTGKNSGTGNTVRYAKKCGREVFYLKPGM